MTLTVTRDQVAEVAYRASRTKMEVR